MDVETVQISELKTGQKIELDLANREVVLTKLDEPQKFNVEGWFSYEKEIYLIEEKIEEDEPLHFAYTPMTLEEGMRRNEGKFGQNIEMYDFLGRDVEGIEMQDEGTE